VLQEETGKALHGHALSRKDREILRKKRVLEAQIANLKTEFESVEEELNRVYMEEELKKEIAERNRKEMTKIRRGADGIEESGDSQED
jgi:circadian clock protein KaiC